MIFSALGSQQDFCQVNGAIGWFKNDHIISSKSKKADHSSGWAACGHKRGLAPSMPCLTLIYHVICVWKQVEEFCGNFQMKNVNMPLEST